MSLANAALNQNIAAVGARPIGGGQASAAAPHVSISSDQIPGYKARIARLQQDNKSPFAPETRRPLKEKIAQAAPKAAKPEVKELKLHADPVSSEEHVPAFEQAASTPKVLAALVKGLKGTEEYSSLATTLKEFIQEQKVMQGAMA